ncbi:hypothetical protein CFE70_006350 [Pyrenophora teres f. teres 0-1]
MLQMLLSPASRQSFESLPILFILKVSRASCYGCAGLKVVCEGTYPVIDLGKFMVNMASVSMVSDGRPLQHLKRDLEWLQQRLGRPINTDFVTKFAFEE